MRRRLSTLGRVGRVLRPLASTGFVASQLALWAALGPSLIPRTWWMTAANVGLSQVYGYAAGNALEAAGRGVARAVGLRLEWDPDQRRTTRIVGGTTLVTATVATWAHSLRRQNEIADRMDMPHVVVESHAAGLASGYAIFGGLLIGWRTIRRAGRMVRYALGPVLPAVAVPVVSAVVVTGATVLLLDRVVVRRALAHLTERAEAANDLIMPGRTQSCEWFRSGSPQSFEPFENLGARGRAVVSDGPRAAHIAAATGEDALDPIRVYAGTIPGRSFEEQADLVVAELHRTGAFDRRHLVVHTSTGTGWLQEWSLSAFEYHTGGDCATASMQYSVLTSSIAYLFDQRSPRQAGRILFERIRAELEQLPTEARPKLYVAGESLGAAGGHAAFADADDMLAKVDGALWTGTPRVTPIWRELAEHRRPGTPEVAPVVGAGQHIRFVGRRRDLVEDVAGVPFGPWREPRVVYAQHASDPVVWWSPELLWNRPDWLVERTGHDVTDAMQWWPWVTFWQLASDMPTSIRVPGGHGHSYHEETVAIWAAILGKDPLADYSAITDSIRRVSFPDPAAAGVPDPAA